jgi:hypothetical protein
MYCNTPLEYAAEKAASRYPHNFPDDDRWGNYESFNYPLLVCPACGYRVYEGYVRANRHLIYHCPYLIEEVEKIEEESEKEDSDEEEEPGEPEEPVEEPKEPEPEPEPEDLPLLDDMIRWKPWEEEWEKMMEKRRREKEENEEWGRKGPLPPEENDFVSFVPLIPEFGMQATRKIACYKILADFAAPKGDDGWGDDEEPEEEPEEWRKKKKFLCKKRKKNN